MSSFGLVAKSQRGSRFSESYVGLKSYNVGSVAIIASLATKIRDLQLMKGY